MKHSLLKHFIVYTFLILVLFPVTSGSSSKNIYAQDLDGADEVLSKTIVWKIAPMVPFASQNTWFIDEWENAINDVLMSDGAGYEVSIEQVGLIEEPADILELIADGFIMPSRVETLQALCDKGEHVDIITMFPEPVFGELTTLSARWLDLSRSGLFMPLESYVASTTGEPLRASILASERSMATVDGELYGLRTFEPKYMQTVYNLDLMERLTIQNNDIHDNWFLNDHYLDLAQDELQTIPFEWFQFISPHYALSLSRLDPTLFLVMDGETRVDNLFERADTFEYFAKLKSLNDNGQLTFLNTNDVDGDYLPFVSLSPSLASKADRTVAQIPFKRSFRRDDIGQGKVVSIDEIRDVLMVPNSNAPVMDVYENDVHTGIASWSTNPDLAFDFLTRLFSDPRMAEALWFGEQAKDALDEPFQTPYHPYLGSLTNVRLLPNRDLDAEQITNQFADTWLENFPLGFRFDPTPVAREVLAVNQLFDFNGENFSQNAWQLFELTFDDLGDCLKKLLSEMEEAGANVVVVEATRQLDAWKADLISQNP